MYINLKTLALDLDSAQLVVDEIGQKVCGIFPIHPLGYAISPRELDDFVVNNDLFLINDVCESLGSWREGKHAGTSGIAGSFSFYFSHHITNMEGGGVATYDSSFADDLRSIRSHGWSRDRSDVEDWQTGISSNDAKFLFVSTGYNVRPMEIQAAIGISQISDIDVFIDKRRAIALAINAAIDGSCIELIGADNLDQGGDQRGHSWMLLPLRVKGPKAAEKKRQLCMH